MNTKDLVLVELSALPTVFERVLAAKRLLARGEVKSYTEAARLCNISRNALYKYKDKVFERTELASSRTITLSAQLVDRPGVLCKLIDAIAAQGANIVTVNQSMAVDGVAPVSVAIGLGDSTSESELLQNLSAYKEIVSIKII